LLCFGEDFYELEPFCGLDPDDEDVLGELLPEFLLELGPLLEDGLDFEDDYLVLGFELLSFELDFGLDFGLDFELDFFWEGLLEDFDDFLLEGFELEPPFPDPPLPLPDPPLPELPPLLGFLLLPPLLFLLDGFELPPLLF